MEAIIENQSQIEEALGKLLINFKKENYERKTSDYCKRKLELAKQYWAEFQNNNRKICEFAEFDHEYFIEHHFDRTEELYGTIENVISATIERLSASQSHKLDQPNQPSPKQRESEDRPISRPSTSAHTESIYQINNTKSTGVFSKLDELFKKQSINFKAFMRTVNSVNVENLQNKWEFDDALILLNNRWVNIDNLHWEIEGENDGEDITYQIQFNKYEKIYNDVKKSINSKM
jgi:aspartyl/asparaginyl-tRNA synthetase